MRSSGKKGVILLTSSGRKDRDEINDSGTRAGVSLEMKSRDGIKEECRA